MRKLLGFCLAALMLLTSLCVPPSLGGIGEAEAASVSTAKNYYWYQGDSKWKNKYSALAWGKACVVVSIAAQIARTDLVRVDENATTFDTSTKTGFNPATFAKLAVSKGAVTESTASVSWTKIKNAIPGFNHTTDSKYYKPTTFSYYPAKSKQNIIDAMKYFLSKGYYPIIEGPGSTYKTNGGRHYVAVVGVTDTDVRVVDPAYSSKEERSLFSVSPGGNTWTYSMIEKCGNPSGYGCCVLYKADKSYFLQSEPTTYTVTYDANGGYSAPASQTKVEGQALKLASAIPSHSDMIEPGARVFLDANGGTMNDPALFYVDGSLPYLYEGDEVTIRCKFNHWTCVENGMDYYPGDSYNVDANATMYANWEYSKSCGELNLPYPTRNGYHFEGWYDTEGNHVGGSNNTFAPIWETTLTAHWSLDVNGNDDPTTTPTSGYAGGDGLSFSTTTLDGKPYSSAVIKNYDLIVVNYWGEWCGPCVNELPYLQQISQNYKNVLILGVWHGNSVTEALAVAQDAGVTYPLLYPTGVLEDYLRASDSFPHTFFFDSDGNQVDGIEIGAKDYSGWETIIKGRLSKLSQSNTPVVTTSPTPTPTSGTCGDNLYWSFNSNTGELIITGSGAMFTYEQYNYPWNEFIFEIVSINLPNGLTTIGDNAFHGCVELTSIVIPNSVQIIGDGTFNECHNLKTVSLPSSITNIGDYTFGHCCALTSIKIPNSVKTIGNGAFWCCESIETLTLPDSITSIGECAFAYCQVKSISIPPKVTCINDGTFVCGGITSISLPKGITAIKEGAFEDCSDLKTVNYAGTETQKKQIEILYGNDDLLNATWHYDEEAPAVTPMPEPATIKKVQVKKSVKLQVPKVKGNSYQWYFRTSKNAAWQSMGKKGAGKVKLSVKTTMAMDGYQYRCRVTSPTGAVSYTDIYELYVYEQLKVKKQPKWGKASLPGAKMPLTITAQGANSYQWVTRPNGSSPWTRIEGATGTSYVVDVQEGMAGRQYACQISGKAGTAQSKAAVVKIAPWPKVKFSKQPVLKKPVAPGTVVTLKVTAINTETYQWYFRTSANGAWILYSGATQPNLTFQVRAGTNGYQYKCTVKGRGGSVDSKPVTLKVVTP